MRILSLRLGKVVGNEKRGGWDQWRSWLALSSIILVSRGSKVIFPFEHALFCKTNFRFCFLQTNRRLLLQKELLSEQVHRNYNFIISFCGLK
jgi:hypothetical protein